MKKSTFICLAMCFLSLLVYAGTDTYSGKEMKQVAPPPCPQWYADNEFNVGLWGTYVFSGNEWQNDRYLEADHAWGGGVDLKYFFHRYFGVGIEGWVVGARRAFDHVDGIALGVSPSEIFSAPPTEHEHESRAVGSVLGTLTLRYPISCTRFAPYLFAGGGGIFGGGEKTHLVVKEIPEFVGPLAAFGVRTRQSGSETEGIAQFGGGIEVRITPHIGWIGDFSWNVVDGSDNNFGMVRTGMNFAF